MFGDGGNAVTNEDVLKSFGAEVQAEHALIAHRMTWYATSQSFLFTAFAISGNQNDLKYFFLVGMPALGIVLSEFARRAIWAAIFVQNDLINEQHGLMSSMRELLKNQPDELRVFEAFAKTTCCGRKTKYRLHDRAMSAPKAIPIVFMIAWAVGLVYGLGRLMVLRA
jgi:hypothetical protein